MATKYIVDTHSKTDETWTSHSWLEVSGLIVDITAGQFEDAPSAWIVSREKRWHDSFEVKSHSRLEEKVAMAPPYLKTLEKKCVVYFKSPQSKFRSMIENQVATG